MTSDRQLDDERRGALFWLAMALAVLFPLRLLLKTVDAPMVLRLTLGLVFISTLAVLAGVFAAGRLRGGLVPARAAAGVWGIALFLVAFLLLLSDRSPLFTVGVGLAGLVGVGAALVASLWD